ncbi:MAG: hypothetical protein J6X72_07080 [Clostridia bacterium]|nr:hypothetical protein [Clostridia bacterium]
MKPKTTVKTERTACPQQKGDTRRFAVMRVAILLLILSLLVTSGILTYAKFTNSLYAQRTVAAYDAVGERFSSNYLVAGGGVRTVSVASAQETPTAIVTVCNYEQGKQMYPNTLDIDYTVTLELVKLSGVSYVPATAGEVGAHQITVSHGGQTVYLNSGNLSDDETFSGTLYADYGATSDAYTVSFEPYQNQIFLRMTVVPDENLALSNLIGVLKSEIKMAGASSSWTGSFQDATGNAPSSYDGFNYRVNGVGSGTFTLRWDATKVGLSDMSRMTLLSIPGATQDGSSITFPVDAEDVNLYDLQFYKINITSETWDVMTSSVVIYGFVAS